MAQENRSALVWDLPLRLYHWLLATGIVVQWLSAEVLEDAMQIHMYGGYGILTLLLFRLIWGFVGPEYARFNQFLRGPSTTLVYLRSLFGKQPLHYTGHTPMGGLWSLLAILLVAVQAISGLFTNDDVLFSGPWYASASQYWQDMASWLHHNMFNILVAFIFLHIAVVLWYRFKFRQDLVSPMLHGKKSGASGITSSRLLLALIVLIIAAGVVYWGVEIAPPEVVEEFYF